MRVSKNPFEVERSRAKLAKKLKFSELLRTYSSGYSEIRDKNTSELWDLLNRANCTLAEDKNPMLKDRLRLTANMINGDNLKILNIGFGSGNLEKIYFARKKNFNWCGIDISRESVKKALKKYPNGKFEVGNIKDINSKNSSFDYVVALEVLEHIRPVYTFKALGEINRVLKPEGKIIISVPLNEGLEVMISKGDNPNAHVRIYTPSLIKAELSIAGFKILKEQVLFAFSKFYKIKTFISKYLIRGIRHPNNIIILAQKR